MKTSILAITSLFLMTILLTCDKKKAQEPKEEVEETVSEPTTEEPNIPTVKPPYQAVGFRKTACFGKCPIYEVKFFTNNTATWVGKMNVDRMGAYEAELKEEMIKNIRAKAYELGYFDFYSEYPTEHKIADLPSTITYMRVGDMEKSVKNTHEAPKKLIEFEAYLQNIISNLDWKPAAKD